MKNALISELFTDLLSGLSAGDYFLGDFRWY